VKIGVDGTGPGSVPMSVCGISGIKPGGFATGSCVLMAEVRELIMHLSNVQRNIALSWSVFCGCMNLKVITSNSRV
jgi:hypothetical protein